MFDLSLSSAPSVGPQSFIMTSDSEEKRQKWEETRAALLKVCNCLTVLIRGLYMLLK